MIREEWASEAYSKSEDEIGGVAMVLCYEQCVGEVDKALNATDQIERQD